MEAAVVVVEEEEMVGDEQLAFSSDIDQEDLVGCTYGISDLLRRTVRTCDRKAQAYQPVPNA
jgi:hypothetical protein